MRAWKRPVVPSVPGHSDAPRLHDTATGKIVEARPTDIARLYVCGITPYDATHIGHAATYLAFDTLQRAWLDAGYRVHYAQNITDVDDPLLERATATGVNWRELAESQVELFRTDMEALGIIPPDDYVAVTEVIDEIAAAVDQLWDAGLAYPVDTSDALPGASGEPTADIYFDIRQAERQAPWKLGEESNLDPATMLALFAERGGDPDRAGKRDPLDPLLWRAARAGEPAWPSKAGAGRPGWHIECSVIALKELGTDFTVQGGGSDLIFPHHDMSAGHAAALSGHPLAGVYSHTGMVAYQGEKMSKSLGNLVLVSSLRRAGVDPRAIRLALLAHHYRADWEWTDAQVGDAERRLARWQAAFGAPAASAPGSAAAVVARLRAALTDDLDTPRALAVVDAAAEHPLDDPALLVRAIDALLGVAL
ncbi:L-cysteine:1D-myo-inositol 2-amino-2-deoxy-alpha-D-glucopyranoside ligase [Cryobacterium psychrotolerans]|uniref:L-cysteine:1D-myo-inositol 2-amino-2-deoxy-alpha-D-glucopyranoside ligase n=1 Tax=Cryobacterium psychrotolerans TaxID=386301 RepID=A0A1G8ZIM0_9MICO|nr:MULTISPECIES: cysteine--1-D-myo-inosityl 2-amino-2-deoxy-alpha-D-glucopyranoside ligase [Cryobacterium]TFD48116.1 cysteine--1-D-myo-inosityl 2-amino-2-deoxy-alpha-D-glucopyranoside ligase [Cryobacterium sp. TMT1-2-1]TFD87535.1 cysteine--1-D-myo-inosityl 2-amino-2-deoxy-alpha-D-glucopyranoside ligase [Cryobacterium psychrotolerans]SDK14972.1 L-cysteine:1D-myo-inositol 2-amino-2-deoxy-alpha-D-glucopyranoside ligase [Cryobacterium psychrotolerans]